MSKEAIGFVNDGICIKDEEGNYLPIDTKTYTPIIIQKIDEWFDKNTSLKNISIIITDSIKEVFNITKMFKSSDNSSIIPKNNKLYNYLTDYIVNHPIYIKQKNRAIERRKEITKGLQEYKKKNEQYFLYYRKKSIIYDNIDRNRGFSFYK